MMHRLASLVLCLAAACGPRDAHTPTARADSAASPRASAAVPLEFQPVFMALDTRLTRGQRDTMRTALRDSSWMYHMSVGLMIRNEFGLWRGGPLQSYFLARGVKHPDDMSGIVLEAYGSYLRGEPIDVPALIRRQPPAPSPDSYQVLQAPSKASRPHPPTP